MWIPNPLKPTQGQDIYRFPEDLFEIIGKVHKLQVWVADITYVRLKERFIYVALLMDVFTRMIRGWNLSQHLTQSLTLHPLEQALHNAVPEIHHSDQGVQYLSNAYISILTQHGVEISVAQRGRPWENGYAERLIRTLKEEEVHLNDYQNIHEVQRSHRAFYHTRLSPQTPTCGVRVFDSYGISAKKLVLTLGNFGPNKWWHYKLIGFESRNAIILIVSKHVRGHEILWQIFKRTSISFMRLLEEATMTIVF